ncbi:hypothetical protein [Jeotgalicoccus psychrophilus]|uniref:hypothetical protein n=1 Tax=Jeotgalicoccus psychrophilus TaxID=157228 RepID=UPI000415AA73|nr:hypothetical protein [Jeotgalicoccus psychrophilus]
MNGFLMFLLIISMYPIMKVIFYLPISAMLRNHKNRNSLSIILTAVMTVILFIVLLVTAYVTMDYTLTNERSIFNSGPEFYYFIGFTYVLGLFAAVVLLVLKFINRNSATTIPETAENKTPSETDKNNRTGFENIILVLVIGGFAALILIIFYLQWALTNT